MSEHEHITDLGTNSDDTPYEAVPQLAGNAAFIDKMARLRELKELKDHLFNDDERRGPLGEFEALKRECAALAAVAGFKSVAFGDLRVGTSDGGVTRGKVTGARMIEVLLETYGKPPTYDQMAAIATSAKECAIQELAAAIAPSVIVLAKSADTPRAGSIRVEWIGAKGRGARGKARGGEGSVQ